MQFNKRWKFRSEKFLPCFWSQVNDRITLSSKEIILFSNRWIYFDFQGFKTALELTNISNINSILLILRKSNLYLFLWKIIIILILPLLSAMYLLSYVSYVNCHPQPSWITMILDTKVFVTEISAQSNLYLFTYCFFGAPVSI